MNKKAYIIIQDSDPNQVIEAVQKMSDLYVDVDFSRGIKIFQSKENPSSFVLNFSFLPDFERFKYFVNYLQYPHVDNFSGTVRGFWTISSNDDLPKKHISQRVMLYVSDLDEDGDNVYATFDAEQNAYILGFAMGHEYQRLNQVDLPFKEPAIQSSQFNLVQTIQPDPSAIKKRSGKGCLLVLTFMILCATWLLFQF